MQNVLPQKNFPSVAFSTTTFDEFLLLFDFDPLFLILLKQRRPTLKFLKPLKHNT